MSENFNQNIDETVSDSALQTLAELAAIVRDERLSELEFQQDGIRFRLAAPRRAMPNPLPSPLSAAPEFFEETFEAEMWAEETTTLAPIAAKANGLEIVSPMSGLFYRAPSPAEPNYVEIGERVEIGKTLGLIEAMKTYNEITAETAGVVTEIHVENSALVQPGDVLLVILPD